MARWKLAIGVAIGMVVWAVLAFGFVPRVIEHAHAGQSWPLLNGLINHTDPENTLAYYQHKWRMIALGGLVLPPLAAAGWLLLRSAWFRRRMAPATATDLGMIRIIITGIALADTANMHLANTALLPKDLDQPMGVVTMLESLGIGFECWLNEALFLGWLQGATIAALVLGLLGFWTRPALAVAALLYLLAAGVVRQHVHFYHGHLVPLWVLMWLPFTPCGDALSIDRWWARLRGRFVVAADEPAVIYTWSRYVVWALVAVPYFLTGMNKVLIGGWYWWEPLNMKVTILSAHMNDFGNAFFSWSPGLLLKDAPPAFFGFLGLTTLFIEIGYISVLFTHWGRYVFPVLGCLMHVGILVLQKILFWDLMILEAVFLNFSWLKLKLIGRADVVPANGDSSAAGRRPPAVPGWIFTSVGAVLFVTPFLAALGRIEKYPVTAWNLFSHKNTAPVAAGWRLTEALQNGGTRRADPGRFFQVLGTHTHMDMIMYGLGGKRPRDYLVFLKTYADAHNAVAPPSEQIVAFELAVWRWNFAEHPEGPEAAVKTKSIVTTMAELEKVTSRVTCAGGD